MKDLLLPIGSVVRLKEEEFYDYMIMGYYPVDKEKGEIFEYSAVVYPSGLVSADAMYHFDSDSIVSVLHKGYTTEEYDALREALPLLLGELASQVKGADEENYAKEHI